MVCIFSRYPAPGACKSRLAAALGNDATATLARAFLIDLCERCATTPADIQWILCVDPPSSLQQFRALLQEASGALQRFALLPQSAGGLGERLASALQSARGQNATAVAFIGSDSPEIDLTALMDALRIARDGRAAMQRASDGGYVLLALPATAPLAVFENVEWSTAHTAESQAARLRACGLEVIDLPGVGDDIDTIEDVLRLRERLNTSVLPLARTRSAMRDLAATLDSLCRPT